MRVYKKIFILIFIVGSLLRFWGFPHNFAWNGDIGRDFLAGHLIAFSNQQTNLGHHNSGIDSEYPPYYYYFMSVLTRILVKYENIVLFIIALHSFSIYILYKAVKNYFSPLVGLLTSFFYALSPRAITAATIPLTANFSLIPFIFSCFLLSAYCKTKKTYLLILTSFFLILTSSIFYGALLFLPLFFLIIFFNNQSFKKRVISSSLFILSSIVLFYVMFFHTFEDTPLSYVLFFNNSLINQFNATHFLKISTGELKKYFYLLTYPTILSYFISWAFLFLKKINIKNMLFLAFYFLCFLIALSLRKMMLPHYLILTTPLITLLISLTLAKFYSLNKALFVVLFIITLYSSGSYLPLKFVQTWPNPETYITLDNFLKKKYQNPNIIMSDGLISVGWDSRSLWYFQRDRFDFLISSRHPEIVQKQNEQKTIHICRCLENQCNFCKTLVKQYNLKFVEKIVFGYMNFLIYDPM